MEIFRSVTTGERNEKYSIAEKIYREKYGEYLYDDFRMFSARLSMALADGMVQVSPGRPLKTKK